jgi:hypothetical protein
MGQVVRALSRKSGFLGDLRHRHPHPQRVLAAFAQLIVGVAPAIPAASRACLAFRIVPMAWSRSLAMPSKLSPAAGQV